MSWDINHVVLVGRLTRDPELSYTPSGTAVCRFSIAVNRSSGPGSGDDGSGTSYFNIVTWNKTAEICKEYLSKGKQVGIDGRLQQRRWEGQDGVKRSTIEIVATNVQFFGSPKQDYESAPRAGNAPQKEPEVTEEDSPFISEKAEDSEPEPFISELDDDDIPF